MVEGTFLITPVWHAIRWTWHDPDGYNIISGPLADVTLIGGAYALYRHHNCHVAGCPRIGRHKVTGTDFVVCRRHHPDDPPSAEQIRIEHEKAITRREALVDELLTHVGERTHGDEPPRPST